LRLILEQNYIRRFIRTGMETGLLWWNQDFIRESGLLWNQTSMGSALLYAIWTFMESALLYAIWALWNPAFKSVLLLWDLRFYYGIACPKMPKRIKGNGQVGG